MLVWALISWWYTEGWLQLIKRTRWRLLEAFDFFSIGLLLKNLFTPYRQISVSGKVIGSVNTQLRAWTDKQISRVIGAILRLTVILFGLVVLVLALAVSAIALLGWPLLPIAPLIGIVATIGRLK
ncbi:MAG TPA: hypothetical protein VNX65_00395 [Patescibacteria group bacterium]|jgi:hypothetical protein|nr:hypothetical protein [Patescibacteria group bacterium]